MICHSASLKSLGYDFRSIHPIIKHNYKFQRSFVLFKHPLRDYGDHARIYIYDNNIHNPSTKYLDSEDDYPYIIINKSSNSWLYPKNQGFRDEPYSIFFLPYSVANGDLTLPGSQDFLIKGGSLELAGILDFLWGSASSYVEDDEGNKAGWVDGELLLEIPDAVAIPSWGNANDSNWEFYVLPVGDYTTHIKGNGTGKYNASIFLGQSMVLIENVDSNPDTNDTLTFRYENAEFVNNNITPTPIMSFNTSDAHKKYSITFGERFLVSGTIRLYSIKNTSISNGSIAIFRPSPDFNSLIYTNRGPEAITYSIELQNSMISPEVEITDTLPTASHSDIVIGPMETHVLTPENWLNLDKSEINLIVEECGDNECRAGEDFYNCPEDCEEIICIEPYDDIHITESTVLCPKPYYLYDGGDGGVIHIDSDDVVLDCNGAQLFGNGHGIAIISDLTKNITVKNCYIQNFSTAVMFNDVTNAKIFHSAFVSNADSGIELVGNNQSQITQNYIRDNGYGIQIYSSIDTEISQNLVCPNINIDIYSHMNNVNNTGFDNACDNASGWDDLNSTGCTYNCTYPACVIPTDDLYINSDITLCPGVYNIPDSGAEGVIIINASNIVLDCNGATINGDNSGVGIYNPGFDNVTIKNGNVLNYENGIHLFGSDNSIISNNNLSYSGNRGISIEGSHHCDVYGNSVSFSGDRGIVFEGGGNNAAYNNIVYNNSAYGAIEAISSDNNEIYNNKAYFNRWGIATNHGSNNQIYGNIIYGNELGVYLDWPSTNNRVFNNNVSSNRKGIWTNHNSTDNIIAGNLIFSNEYAGIRIETDSNTITNNIANNNLIGLYLCADSTGNTVNTNTFCNNSRYDIQDEDSNSGDENACDLTDNWNDAGTTGCTYTCIGKPDTVISEIKCDRESDRIGYRIENIGKAAAPASHHTALLVKFGDAWEEMCQDHIDFDLNPGDSYQRWFECYTWPECQTIEVKVCADNYDVIKESDEDNNCLEKKCECAPLKKPDLGIKDIKLTRGGDYCYVDYQISNIGTASASASTTYLYVDSEKVASDSTGSLAPGAFRWDKFTAYRTTGAHTYKVCADGPNTISESSKANNCRTENLTCSLRLDIYFADGGESPGSVYHYNTTTGIEETVYTRPSRNLHSFTFHPHIPEKLYFVNANENKIYRTLQTSSGWTPEEVVYTHTTCVRDIAFAFGKDDELRLYFSEATGAGENGKIYKIEDGKASLYYEVKLADVGGFWGGDFAFDDNGNLYLSSGNQIPASIYKVEGGGVKEIFKDVKECISGLIYADGALYYANWGTKIYRLDLSTVERTVVYSNSKRTWLSDVDFRPELIG